MYMYRYEKRVKYYGHLENDDEATTTQSLIKDQNQMYSIRAFGDGLRQAQTGIQTSFTVDAQSAINLDNDVKVVVSTPSKQACHMQVINNGNGTWTVNYLPNEVGETYIDVFFGDDLVNGSPFKVNVFDANQIRVTDIHGGTVGHLVKFHIDASEAGVGQLEIVVQDGQIPCDATACGSFHFDATFLPIETGPYSIDVKFNGWLVPGSPFICYVNDLSRVTLSDSLTKAHVGIPLSFDINHADFYDHSNQTVPLDVFITAPSGRFVPFKRSQLNESITRIDYILNEIGTHRVDIRSKHSSSDKMDINGSPFALKSYDCTRIIVSEIPHLVIHNHPVEFTVDASKGGEGQLEVAINDGLVPNQVQALGNSKFLFTFIPKTNDPHTISIKFNGHQLPGFPKTCQIFSTNDITTRGPGLSQALLGSQTWFTIEMPHGDTKDVQVTVLTPMNEKLNPTTRLTSEGLRVDWVPSEVGTYTVHVTFANNPVPGSPFRVKCYDPKKVIITPPTNDSTVRKVTRFLIDASRAGEGNLEISVSHSGRNIPNQVASTGNSRFEVQFTPQEAAVHYCNVLFNGEPVPGSPFNINVMDAQRVVVFGKGLGSVPVNIPTSFTIVTQNAGVGDLKCSIKGPAEHLIPCVMTKIDADRYEVTYTPNHVGDFQIEILNNNIPTDNQPYVARAFDINKITVHDFPSSSTVDSLTDFIIDATDSGPGNLEIAIAIDESNIPNHVDNERGTRFRVKFTPDRPGVHYVDIKFNGIDINGSPLKCNVFSSDFKLENYEWAPINKRAMFLIKTKSNSALNPNIYVDILMPSGKCVQGKIEEVRNNYYIPYNPNEIGEHQIIFYGDKGKKLLLTKFRCQVYDSRKLRISDLPPGIPHQLYKFTVNTADAGEGLLAVKIKQNGNRIAHEQNRTKPHLYEITFLPETSDDCIVTVTFNGENNFGPLLVSMAASSKKIHVSRIPAGIVGQPIAFTIDLDEPKPIAVLVTESHNGRSIPHALVPVSAEKTRYQVKFTPSTARQHTISVSYEGHPQLTYHADVFDINKIRVSGIADGTVGVPVVFSVDTHGAGEGHLEVTISDDKRTLPAELKSVQTRKFDIGFLPEISGIHLIAISFNSIAVDGSPFKINVCDPPINGKESAEDEEDDADDHEFLIGGQLEGTKVGELAWLICDSELSEIYEDFDLFVTDPDQTIIKHTRIQDSGGRWRVEFEPTKAGIHQIQTIDRSNGTKKSPVVLASMDILPAEHERIIEGERIIHPCGTNLIIINSTDENMKFSLTRSNGNPVPIKVRRESSQTKLLFDLAEADYYQFTIVNNKSEQIFDIHCVDEETDIFRNGGIEDITRLIVDQSKINGNDVNVIVKDPLAHTIPAAFYRNLSRDLVVEYVPTKQDYHEVFIRIQNNLLDICPIRIMSFGANSPFEPVLRVQVKEVLKHSFEGVIDNLDKLEIEITDPFDKPLAFHRSANENGELTISVVPVRVGTHWIRISNEDSRNYALLPIFAFDDDYVPLSPIASPTPGDKKSPDRQIKANHTTDSPTESPFQRILGKDLTTISETSETSSQSSSNTSSRLPSPIKEVAEFSSQATSNEPYKQTATDDRSSPEVQILDVADLEDPGVRVVSNFSFKDPDDKFQITIYDADRKLIDYKTEYLIDGRKRISYEPNVIGPVEIHISKDNEPVDGSPLIVYAFDPTAVCLKDFSEKMQVDAKNRFTIDPTKAGKGSLKVAIKGPNNRSLALKMFKRANGQIIVEFEPTISGSHSIYVLFNRIPIPDSPLRLIVEPNDAKKVSDEPVEERITHQGHGIVEQYQRFKDGSLRLVLHFDKPEQYDWDQVRGEYLIQVKQASTDHQEATTKSIQTSLTEEFPSNYSNERERPASIPASMQSPVTFDAIHSRLSKSNENITQSSVQRNALSNEQKLRERITKSEDRGSLLPTLKPLNHLQIQQYNAIKEKFERQQPIDVVFDPRRYPFKVLLPHAYPVVNMDVHFLIDLPHIAYINVTINAIDIPIQAARRSDDTFLLKFRPTIAGDYSIILKDYIEKPVPGSPFMFPVYNPSVVRFENLSRSQIINNCHIICNVDQAGPGKLFVMVYSQTNNDQLFEPTTIPIQINPLPFNHIRIGVLPPKVGLYRIYVAYRNIPVKGE